MAKQIRFDIKLNADGKELVGAAVSDIKELRRAWDDSAKGMKKFTEGLVLNTFKNKRLNRCCHCAIQEGECCSKFGDFGSYWWYFERGGSDWVFMVLF